MTADLPPVTSARDDYPKLHFAHTGPRHQGQTSNEAQAALSELDELRAWKRDAAVMLAAWDDMFEAVIGSVGHVDVPTVERPGFVAGEIGRLREEMHVLLDLWRLAYLHGPVHLSTRGAHGVWRAVTVDGLTYNLDDPADVVLLRGAAVDASNRPVHRLTPTTSEPSQEVCAEHDWFDDHCLQDDSGFVIRCRRCLRLRPLHEMRHPPIPRPVEQQGAPMPDRSEIPPEVVAEYVRLTDEDRAGVQRPSVPADEVIAMFDTAADPPSIVIEELVLEPVSANATFMEWWPAGVTRYASSDQAVEVAANRAKSTGLIHRVLVNDETVWSSDGWSW